jgi:hypothetical protein
MASCCCKVQQIPNDGYVDYQPLGYQPKISKSLKVYRLPERLLIALSRRSVKNPDSLQTAHLRHSKLISLLILI